jgi:hypothetical protein
MGFIGNSIFREGGLTANIIALHERCKMVRERILLYEGATWNQHIPYEVPEAVEGHSQNGLQAESVEVSIVFIGWVRRAVQRPRKNNAKVDRSGVGLRFG